MKILGIDPGYDRLGIAVILKSPKQKEAVLYSDCFQTSSKDSIYDRLFQIGQEVGRVMDEFEPEIVALETLFITKNQKTAMRVAEARGIIIYEAIERGLEVVEYNPMQIKTAITSDGSSDKERMMRMIPMLVSIPAKKKIIDDEYDAIGVALTASAHLK